MKKTTSAIIMTLTVLSTHALAFDFYGIKSGMNRGEINKIFDCSTDAECISVKKGFMGKKDVLDMHPVFSKLLFDKIRFFYTESNELWKIVVKINGVHGILQSIAAEEVLKETFKGQKIIASDASDDPHYTSMYFTIIFKDEELAKSAISNYKERLKKKL